MSAPASSSSARAPYAGASGRPSPSRRPSTGIQRAEVARHEQGEHAEQGGREGRGEEAGLPHQAAEPGQGRGEQADDQGHPGTSVVRPRRGGPPGDVRRRARRRLRGAPGVVGAGGRARPRRRARRPGRRSPRPTASRSATATTGSPGRRSRAASIRRRRGRRRPGSRRGFFSACGGASRAGRVRSVARAPAGGRYPRRRCPHADPDRRHARVRATNPSSSRRWRRCSPRSASRSTSCSSTTGAPTTPSHGSLPIPASPSWTPAPTSASPVAATRAPGTHAASSWPSSTATPWSARTRWPGSWPSRTTPASASRRRPCGCTTTPTRSTRPATRCTSRA